MVSLGAKAPVTLFEGIHGWFKAMSDKVDTDVILSDLGERWEILNSYTKLYPTCRHCHPGIDIALDFFREGIDISKIAKIDIFTHSVGISEVGLVFEPQNFEEAMFSMSYAVANALKYGKVGLTELYSNLRNAEIIELSKKHEIFLSEAMDKMYPIERACRMEITLTDGSTLIKEVTLPRGEPETSISDQEYIHKFQDILDNKCNTQDVLRFWDLAVESPISEVNIDDIITHITKLNKQLK